MTASFYNFGISIDKALTVVAKKASYNKCLHLPLEMKNIHLSKLYE